MINKGKYGKKINLNIKLEAEIIVKYSKLLSFY